MVVNYNGDLIAEDGFQLSASNRGFKYGDALFETLKIANEGVVFVEDHYFRLMASMRVLRMEIPMSFTLSFFENEILNTINANKGEVTSVRFSVFRAAEGLYLPLTNNISYLVECRNLPVTMKTTYEVELFKDFTINADFLSTLKTNNRVLNVVASIYAKENNYENVVLLNQYKNAVEFVNGNLFLIRENMVVTPPLSEGCIKGVARKNIINLLDKHPDFTIIEKTISPFDIQKADEMFMSNAIVGVQPVTKYKKKNFATVKSEQIRALLLNLS